LKSTEELVNDLITGKLRALYIIGNSIFLPEEALAVIETLAFCVVQTSHPSPLVNRAHAVLPAAMWPELDGTMTNRAKKTQRLRMAISPPFSAKPHWNILVQVARRAGMTLDFSSASNVFEKMSREVPFFENATWGKDIPAMLLRFAQSRG
jgi:predicted molibdopterin-dependent oxidoreductase YjgC